MEGIGQFIPLILIITVIVVVIKVRNKGRETRIDEFNKKHGTNFKNELELNDFVATELGKDNYYIPTLNYPTFVHMKQFINKFSTDDWRDSCSWALTDDKIFIINGYAQAKPFHYYHKDFCTQELIERYEQFVI